VIRFPTIRLGENLPIPPLQMKCRRLPTSVRPKSRRLRSHEYNYARRLSTKKKPGDFCMTIFKAIARCHTRISWD
jgi:hypothetical protein